ncbi:unnamed protein product [Absidia cylindrospora]
MKTAIQYYHQLHQYYEPYVYQAMVTNDAYWIRNITLYHYNGVRKTITYTFILAQGSSGQVLYGLLGNTEFRLMEWIWNH